MWFKCTKNKKVSFTSLRANGYICVLSKVMKVWIKQVAAGWPQDFVPCNFRWKTQAWLLESFFNHIAPDVWTPNSSDCNPIDFFVWDVAKYETNKSICNVKDKLRVKITRAFRDLKWKTVTKPCGWF